MAQAQGVAVRRYPTGRQLPEVVNLQRPILTPRQVAFLVLRTSEQRNAEDEQVIQQLGEQQPELASAIELEDFAQLLRQRQPEQRLKVLKRPMYGRAGIELLSQRFLLAS